MDASQEGRSRGDGQAPLALIERLDRQGHVLQSTMVYHWPWRIGRAFDADLVLDDPHLAPQHAELFEADGHLNVLVGDTVNGAFVGERHLQSGEIQALDASRALRLGNTRLRVRMATDPMAPERPLDRHLAHAAHKPQGPLWRVVLPLLLLTLAYAVFDEWLDNDPGTPVSNYLSATLILLSVIAGWTLFWSLGSKLFQGSLEFMGHLRLALLYGLVWTALDGILPLLAYGLDWPMLSHASNVVGAAVLCTLVWAHLGLILPAHRRGLTAGAVAIYALGVGLHVWFNEQRTGQPFSERYATALPPPAWRLVGTSPTGALLQDARGLKAKLDKQAKEDREDENVEPPEED